MHFCRQDRMTIIWLPAKIECQLGKTRKHECRFPNPHCGDLGTRHVSFPIPHCGDFGAERRGFSFPIPHCGEFGSRHWPIPESPLWGFGNESVLSCFSDLGPKNPQTCPNMSQHVPQKSQISPKEFSNTPHRIPNQVPKMYQQSPRESKTCPNRVPTGSKQVLSRIGI